MTRLTICIPTRNRQRYAMDAARHMLASKRDDFEILIGDNSDDAAPLASFVAEMNDSRAALAASGRKAAGDAGQLGTDATACTRRMDQHHRR
ncbi:hypothetical protein OEG86_07985 [Hoeflea alexandrii]|uniref:hypothetical protein n=1 Tax=Hoeflea alexandrii TaxID=288436 RepID=UPI00226D743F|nr:hypothetical protein [Hoeflea alexandrii]MCY0152189.1 hypothetical protein [Hoeflea alexandrii]